VNIAMHLQALAQISSGRILNCTIEGIGIALFAWILLRAFGRQNSGTQFAVWFSALLAIAMLPLLDNSALVRGHCTYLRCGCSWLQSV